MFSNFLRCNRKKERHGRVRPFYPLTLSCACRCLRLASSIVSLRNRTVERRGPQNTCVWQTWQAYYLCVLWWSLPELMLSGLLQKNLFKGRWSSAEKLFQTKLLSRLSHKVCRLLSSPVLLRKLTNVLICVAKTTIRIACIASVSDRVIERNMEREQ